MTRVLLFVLIGLSTTSFRVTAAEPSHEKAIIIHAPRPEMPYSARIAHHTGAGTYRLFLAADGTVTRVAIEKSAGWADLNQAAITAFRQWRAKPSYARSIVVPASFSVRHR